NNLTTSQLQLIAINPGSIYDGLGGNDFVVLPDNYNEDLGDGASLGWTANTFFNAHDVAGQEYTISGGKSDDRIRLGNGTDIVYGSPGNDLIIGGLGADTFDYTGGKFQNFSGFSSGTAQQLVGGHFSFATESATQNVLELPGSPDDYSFNVQFFADV